ncbi:amidohydrolase family protein [Planctomycetota bacterium]
MCNTDVPSKMLIIVIGVLSGLGLCVGQETHPSVNRAAEILRRADATPKAIVDTHIHFYQVTRAGGVPWPPKDSKLLYRDVLPDDYKQVARPLGILASGVVEASPLQRDNLWILELIQDDSFFPFFVAKLEIGATDFIKNLHELTKNDRFVGIRGGLPGAKLDLDDRSIDHLKTLARLGLSLDLFSRGTRHPKAKISKLGETVPDLRIMIDHLGGAETDTVDPQWEQDMTLLAGNPNIYMKFSSFFDMVSSSVGKNTPPKSPNDLAYYKAHFDVLMREFGPDRLVWGSNWPVVTVGGTLALQVKLAEDYLAPLGSEVRNKVMYQNALKFYKRMTPK